VNTSKRKGTGNKGKKASIKSKVQVCLLDYFPTFRRFSMGRSSVAEMRRARKMLVETGLKTVLAQTTIGHLGP